MHFSKGVEAHVLVSFYQQTKTWSSTVTQTEWRNSLGSCINQKHRGLPCRKKLCFWVVRSEAIVNCQTEQLPRCILATFLFPIWKSKSVSFQPTPFQMPWIKISPFFGLFNKFDLEFPGLCSLQCLHLHTPRSHPTLRASWSQAQQLVNPSFKWSSLQTFAVINSSGLINENLFFHSFKRSGQVLGIRYSFTEEFARGSWSLQWVSQRAMKLSCRKGEKVKNTIRIKAKRSVIHWINI